MTPADRVALFGVVVVTGVVAMGVAFHVMTWPGEVAGPPDSAQAVAVGVGLWAILVTALLAGAWVAGARTAARLRALAQRVVTSSDPGTALAQARHGLGAIGDALGPLATRLGERSQRVEALEEHRGALYQISPHPLLLCRLGGGVVEANPAFYALTGLDPMHVREVPLAALAGTFPAGDFAALAERSLAEYAAVGGVESWVLDRDGERRPVEVALRAFRSGDEPLVLFQLTDQRYVRSLEHRVRSFTDVLDLHVDRRVRELTAGRQELEQALDAGGVVVASFDATGATVRWNGAARLLTGRPLAEVAHFGAAVEALGMRGDQPALFARWFWGMSDEPFVGSHTVGGAGDGLADRRLLWTRAYARTHGASDRRTLVGVRVPTSRSVPARPSEPVPARPSGSASR